MEEVPTSFGPGELNAFLRRPDDRPVVAELLANLNGTTTLSPGCSSSTPAISRRTPSTASTPELQGVLLRPGRHRPDGRGPPAVSPTGEPLNPWFEEIVAAGTGRTFHMDDNRRWLEVTRPMLEAFWHARFFLQMAVRYGAELDVAPSTMPYGWAALLCLYNLR